MTTVGEAADKGDPLGQDVARIARNADYVAPEIYPGYWGAGRHGVPDPPRQPAEFTAALLTRYQQAIGRHRARCSPRGCRTSSCGASTTATPTCGRWSTPARSVGVDRFLLWSPRVQYSAGLLDAAPPAG